MMSERKRKRGRPRIAPVISYEAEMRMRNNIPRNIKKPKYLRDAEEESNASRASTPLRSFEDGSAQPQNKNNRGYNPEYDDKNSEFHYGSDFDLDGTSENEAEESDAEVPSLSDLGLLSDDEGVLSDDSHFPQDSTLPSSIAAVSSPNISRPASPEAIWLQNRRVPPITLPPSADDLLIPLEYFMPALSVYEVLHHFRSIIRLSPFRFEEFCGALLSTQQTVLLADIHIALLRALVREDESQATHFGPLDQKDSINVMLYLVDAVTWPQVLHSYLSSDSLGHESLVHMMDKCSYPFTSLQNRLTVLRVLTDEVLSVSGVRELFVSEGRLRYDDHCRACHKTGDLLCCDSCTAVYHLECLGADEAPAMPIDDWTCSVCTKHQVTGVTDCLSVPEASGQLSRHDPLGYDRHGRKYWFLVRRLIIESSEGSVWYYSTCQQVHAVLSLLDPAEYEADLMANVEDQRHEMDRQLAVTEKLTRSLAGSRPMALAVDDEAITKFITEARDLAAVKDELKEEIKDEVNQAIDTSDAVKAEVKEEDVKEEKIEAEEKGLWDHNIVGRAWQLTPTLAERVTANKLLQLRSNGQAFRVGTDGGQSYVNQYSSNPLALNKLQHNEDRDKKRQLSHKFSITNTSPEFKWSGTTYGGLPEVRECIRGCMQQLEQQVSPHLHHPLWSTQRKAWLNQLARSSSARQLAQCLATYVAAIKPVVFQPVWHEGLGHVRLYRLTAFVREERRRQEKKDKKDLEVQVLDDMRSCTPVRFTKLPKHQLWKVKGEEHRAWVGDGWRWIARHRRVHPQDARKVGLRAGPDKVVVAVKTENGLRGLPVTPQVFETLALKSPELQSSLLSPNQLRQLHPTLTPSDSNEIIISSGGVGSTTKQKVQVVMTQLEEHYEDGLVNVSRSLGTRMRLVYPKMPLPCPALDNLLARRLAMPRHNIKKEGAESDGEEADASRGGGTEGSPDVASAGAADADSNIQEIPDSQRSATHRLRPAGHLLKEIRQHKLRYEALDESLGLYRCYSPMCATSPSCCYSPLCRTKSRVREKLINSVKNYTIVTSKPSPFPQVGVYDIIKLSEMDFSEAAADTKKSNINNNNNSSSLNSFFSTVSKAVEADVSCNKASDSEISVKVETELEESSQDCQDHHKFALLEPKEEESDLLSQTCSGKIYLKKLDTSDSKNKPPPRLPPLTTCRVGKDRYSMLVLPAWELKTLCRRWWRHSVAGFAHAAKINPGVWQYPCPRPLFKQTWLYRTATLSTLSAVALQLRVLWHCLRWEDMQEKGASDGKRHITTDTEIVQTEVLKRKHSGRFNEKTEYLRRKVTIPFEVPKPVREFTPSQRSGLRKRRRAQSPEDKRPESMEEWVPEEQLLLWEIRLFGERLERAANLPKKADNPSPIATKIALSGSSFEIKQRMEETLKQQRSVFQQQQREGTATPAKTMLKISSITSGDGKTVTAVKTGPLSNITAAKKLVRTKDGRIISVQTLGNLAPASARLPKVQISPQPQLQHVTPTANKVIRLQNVAGNPRMILPRAPRPIVQVTPTPPQVLTTAPAPATIRLANQNIQIIRLPDGQIKVKGLLDGQQMIQRPDGKFQLINSKPVNATPMVHAVQQPKPAVVLPNSPQLVKLNGQQVVLRKEGSQVVSVSTSEAIRTATGVIINQRPTIPAGSVLLNQKATVVNSSPVKLAPDGSYVSSSTPSSVASGTTATSTQPDTLTLKVQVRMTQQGPKTIIQGLLPSVGLTKDHIRAIQQQVRSMLAQYNLQVDQLSPIMTLTLQVGGATSAQPVMVPQPLQQQQPQTQQQPQQQPQQVTIVRTSTPSLKVPAVLALKNNSTATYIRMPGGAIVPDKKPAAASPVNQGNGQFVLTNNYIQETIQSALGSNDLAPDVQEKLIQLKKYNSEQLTHDASSNTGNSGTPVAATAVVSPAVTPASKRARDASEGSSSEGKKGRGGNKRPRTGESNKQSPTTHSPARRPPHVTGEDGTPPSSKKRRSGGAAATSPADDAKRKSTARLEVQLSRHKDLLKKDILKKRALLEKDLQLQIHRELNIAKQQVEVLEKKAAIGPSKIGSPNKKKKKPGAADQCSSMPGASTTETSLEKGATSPSQNPKKHKSSSNKKLKNKHKKIVCICRTPFDDTKFYVGCDLCANWYHGQCVGITEALSRTMNEYICDDCANAKMNKELYCFCRQPYDETQFYICCEQCEDWYHGRCVGIMQGEADDIDDYICPKCQPNNVWNLPCQKKLTNKDYTELKKLAKTLVAHKNAWPFLDAVDPSEVPDYYKVVRQPMDLRTIERRVKDHHYNRLADFVGDIILLLDNCRLYNPPNSSFVSCAATLESFCCSKLKLLKLKLTNQLPSQP